MQPQKVPLSFSHREGVRLSDRSSTLQRPFGTILASQGSARRSTAGEHPEEPLETHGNLRKLTI
eukprot:3482787-Pyramimonas_sp.AAC.1